SSTQPLQVVQLPSRKRGADATRSWYVGRNPKHTARNYCARGEQMAAFGTFKTLLGRLFDKPSVVAVPADREGAVSARSGAKVNEICTGGGSISLATDATRAHAPMHQLPADVADFTGRATQMEKLLDVLSAPGGRFAMSAIEGMGGVGKTALAVHVAHRL